VERELQTPVGSAQVERIPACQEIDGMTFPANPFVHPVFSALPEKDLLNPAGYSPEFLRAILRGGGLRPLFSADGTAEGRLDIVRQCAFFSVEMALSLGITVSLFAAPVERYAPDLWRNELQEGFLSGGQLGGMMITEPGCGTDLAACVTHCRAGDGGWEISGTKHWAGLTGLADYWLVLAKDGEAGKGFRFPSLNFYICRADPESFRLVKCYETAGLRSIPYGMTEIRAREGVLGPLLRGSKTDRFRRIHGILQRSRISIAAITSGACERLALEAGAHVRNRRVFGKTLAEYGQVQVRLAEIEAAREVSTVLYRIASRAAARADATDTDVDGLSANVVKIVCTDLAFAAATSASQLLGGESYRTDTYIGRATADLRPFRIFEGSNDVLCDAVWQAQEKNSKTGRETFADIIVAAFRQAGMDDPDLTPFGAVGVDGALPQGLRCLGGRMLANAIGLRWCLQEGLFLAACRPLAVRMARDANASIAGGTDAGLVEY
jgi:acyl-CoA dehydrogenase